MLELSMSTKQTSTNISVRPVGSKGSPKVFVATYTNEGLKFQMVLGPLKFEPSKRGRKPVLPVATI